MTDLRVPWLSTAHGDEGCYLAVGAQMAPERALPHSPDDLAQAARQSHSVSLHCQTITQSRSFGDWKRGRLEGCLHEQLLSWFLGVLDPAENVFNIVVKLLVGAKLTLVMSVRHARDIHLGAEMG